MIVDFYYTLRVGVKRGVFSFLFLICIFGYAHGTGNNGIYSINIDGVDIHINGLKNYNGIKMQYALQRIDLYSKGQLQSALKSLKAFKSIRVSYGKNAINIDVIERPMINNILLMRANGQELKSKDKSPMIDKVIGLLPLKKGDTLIDEDVLTSMKILNSHLIKPQSSISIADLFLSYKVRYNDDNTVDIAYTLNTRNYYLRNINIMGIDGFSMGDVMSSVSSKALNYPLPQPIGYISNAIIGNYAIDLSKIVSDSQAIKRFFVSKGYIKCGVDFFFVKNDNNDFVDVNFTVNKENLFYIRDVVLTGFAGENKNKKVLTTINNIIKKIGVSYDFLTLSRAVLGRHASTDNSRDMVNVVNKIIQDMRHEKTIDDSYGVNISWNPSKKSNDKVDMVVMVLKQPNNLLLDTKITNASFPETLPLFYSNILSLMNIFPREQSSKFNYYRARSALGPSLGIMDFKHEPIYSYENDKYSALNTTILSQKWLVAKSLKLEAGYGYSTKDSHSFNASVSVPNVFNTNSTFDSNLNVNINKPKISASISTPLLGGLPISTSVSSSLNFMSLKLGNDPTILQRLQALRFKRLSFSGAFDFLFLDNYYFELGGSIGISNPIHTSLRPEVIIIPKLTIGLRGGMLEKYNSFHPKSGYKFFSRLKLAFSGQAGSSLQFSAGALYAYEIVTDTLSFFIAARMGAVQTLTKSGYATDNLTIADAIYSYEADGYLNMFANVDKFDFYTRASLGIMTRSLEIMPTVSVHGRGYLVGGVVHGTHSGVAAETRIGAGITIQLPMVQALNIDYAYGNTGQKLDHYFGVGVSLVPALSATIPDYLLI